MKKIIVANWKMNPTTEEQAKLLFKAVSEGVRNSEDKEVIICPPSIYLQNLVELHLDNKINHLHVGAQNSYSKNEGAFTGEVSPLMLRNLNVDYVILGHSERRKHFSETDELIHKKIKAALENDLKVIFCIGETDEERSNGEKNKVLEHQIRKGLLDISHLENILIAYEPVWAIGTGHNCSVQETKESVDFIRELVNNKARVLYGGSVNQDNAKDYVKEAKVDGLLVGGASLMPENFITIVNTI